MPLGGTQGSGGGAPEGCWRFWASHQAFGHISESWRPSIRFSLKIACTPTVADSEWALFAPQPPPEPPPAAPQPPWPAGHSTAL